MLLRRESEVADNAEVGFVCVDQNFIWWMRPDGGTGAVEIWNDLI